MQDTIAELWRLVFWHLLNCIAWLQKNMIGSWLHQQMTSTPFPAAEIAAAYDLGCHNPNCCWPSHDKLVTFGACPAARNHCRGLRLAKHLAWNVCSGTFLLGPCAKAVPALLQEIKAALQRPTARTVVKRHWTSAFFCHGQTAVTALLQETMSALRRYQEEAVSADEREKMRERGPILEKLAPELEALNKAADRGWVELVKHIYK